MSNSLKPFVTKAGTWLARPWVLLLVALYAALWFVFDRENLNWHGVATLLTLCMTVFIQRSEHRDTQAIHAKLDELLRVHDDASNVLTQLDEKEPEQVEQFRNQTRANHAKPNAHAGSRRSP